MDHYACVSSLATGAAAPVQVAEEGCAGPEARDGIASGVLSQKDLETASLNVKEMLSTLAGSKQGASASNGPPVADSDHDVTDRRHDVSVPNVCYQGSRHDSVRGRLRASP